MSRTNAKPSASEAAKSSERFSHPSPLENALDFLLTPQVKVASHQEPASELASHQTTEPLASHLPAEIFSHPTPPPEASKLATVEARQPSKLATTLSASYAPDARTGDRHHRSKVQLNIRIALDTDTVITESCAKVKMTKQEFVEVAIHRFAEWIASHEDGLETSKLAHDELMTVFRTDDKIINLYFEVTGNKWKATDDREGVQFNGVDFRLVQRGILAAAIRFRGKKINSFRYFVAEIQLAIEEHSETSDDVKNIDLASLKRYWEKKKAGIPLIDK